MDIVTYALAKKLCKSAVSGVKNYQVDGLDLIINLNDGTSLTMTFPVPTIDAAEMKDSIIDFDGINQEFELPVNDVKLNVYLNGIFLTENVDYIINRQTKPNKIIFDAVYDVFDSCTVTYLEAISNGGNSGGGDINFEDIDFATPDDVDNFFDSAVAVETFATTADIDELFNMS